MQPWNVEIAPRASTYHHAVHREMAPGQSLSNAGDLDKHTMLAL